MSTVTQVTINFAELRQCVSISEEQLLELVAEGILTPEAGTLPEEWRFASTSVSLVHKAERLHRDLTVEWADIPLVLGLLEEVEQLKAENAYLKQRLGRFLQDEQS
ncbi:chaperone modulator CbpM [Halopseudomonas pelagia]|uniref:chaperone modulator CbpM n=1 Tax=Halopseudomonas pelagia TaxID=553151 RepID=UPI0003A5D36B|nr:chaperone modulator CbpM [Halopseudomonas pelagia]|tara:strand:+ start:379 stop:696 length:318 start_codon:yes stop_codon:yes gene_type:complete